MEAMTGIVQSIPWYGWVAIVAILAGAAVKIFGAKNAKG